MDIIVSRFCSNCNKLTKWTVKEIGNYWERYTCKECGISHDTKTQ